MDQLVQFKTESGADVVVRVDERSPGLRQVNRGQGGPLLQAAQTFDAALHGVRAAAESALDVFREGFLSPDSVEIEFGVSLSAEAGAFIAKSTVEGHLVVKLSWAPGTTPQAPDSTSTATTSGS
jgi:hypothetical protein